MFPYNDKFLNMLGVLYPHKRAKSRAFSPFPASSDYEVKETAPSLSEEILGEQTARFNQTANRIATTLMQQLHRKLYGAQFSGDPKELSAKLKANAPQEWEAFRRDMEEKWVPYLWQQRFYNLPFPSFPSRFGASPLQKKRFPSYYSSLLADLLGEGDIYTPRQI